MTAVPPLIQAARAREHLDDPGWVFVDCRFTLGDPAAGHAAFAAGHIPGAVHLDLERDLSGPVGPGTGRHPLPDPGVLADALSRAGIGDGHTVVCHDDAGGAMAAARLWWLLRWLGHSRVTVLDGGLAAWRAAGGPFSADPTPTRAPATFTARPRPELVADTASVREAVATGTGCLVDARAGERYAGRLEPIDPVAGHIPGALSLPHTLLLRDDGTMRAPGTARALAACGDPAHMVAYCGSGVTAALLALAVVHATGTMPRLYPGSWSAWITDPDRPIGTGERP
ncbi:MAG: sulfurtransferase [Thermoleophilia bacterium]